MAGRLQWLFLACVFGPAYCYVSNLPQSYDTIVVGLGAAGVTAATTLAKAGKKVLALEALDRIGGRVKTAKFGDGVVEVGAEWIHGTDHSRVFETANKNNITVIPQDIDLQVFNSDGSPGNVTLVNELVSFCMDLTKDPTEKPEPFGIFVSRKLKEYLGEKNPDVLNDEDFVNEFLEQLNVAVCNGFATDDWNDLSAQMKYQDLKGNLQTSWHRNGYKTFFELLLNTYNNGPGWPTLEIKLNKEVKSVKWPKNSTGNVQVVCADGDTYTANNVILTLSVGVLKERYSSLFSPGLPEEKITAIDKISMGVIGKIIFSFDEVWWPQNFGPMFWWTAADREKYKDTPWLTKIHEISCSKGSNNTLTVWTSGDATKVIEALPEEEVKSKVIELMRKYMGKEYKIPDPTGMIRSNWYSNPFTRGSYTYDNMLIHEYPNARATLGEPLLDSMGSPKVLFAGEATDLTHFSTVHGASDSGHREATRLITTIKQ